MNKKDYNNIVIISLTALVIVFASVLFDKVFGSDMDWVNQHIIFPEYFRMLFYKTGRLLPNLAINLGAGQNIFNFSYYGLMSPIVLISYLLPFMNMTVYTIISSIIIILLSGYLFYRWLFNNGFSSKVCLFSSLVFILATPFIYQMHRNIMFVNYMPFLIMSLLGVDKYLESKNKYLLIIGIFLMIMTSYYFSVGGILVVLIYYLFKDYKNSNSIDKKRLLHFSLLILLAIGLSAVLLLPTVYTLLTGRSESYESFNSLKLLIPNIKIHTLFNGAYSIGLSMFGFMSIIYLFFTKKKENVLLGSILLVILFIPLFMFLLNGGLYLRSKCFIPFIPLICYISAIFFKDYFDDIIDLKRFIYCLLIIGLIVYLFNYKEISYMYLLGLIICLFIKYKFGFKYILCVLVISYSIVTDIYFANKEEVLSINDYKTYFNETVDNSIVNTLENNKSYYRFSNLVNSEKTVNKVYDLEYYSTSIYSSTYNDKYLKLARDVFKLNVPEYNYFFLTNSSNILFNKYMGVKYVYSNYDLGLGYNKLYDNVYVNNETFPLGYVSYSSISEEEFDSIKYPYNLEVLMNNVITKESVNTNRSINAQKVNLDYEILNYNKDNIDIKKNGNGYIINVKEDDSFKIRLKSQLDNKILFINLNGLNRNECYKCNTYITINNVKNLITYKDWTYDNKNYDFHYLISEDNLNELNIEIGKGIYNIDSIETYLLDYSFVEYSNRSVTPFDITSIGNDKIIGEVNALDSGYFVMSIPYDAGFTVKVNGKAVEKEIVNKAFLGFKINKGINNIEISYRSPLLNEGIIISLISLIILVGILISDKIGLKKE